MNRRCIPLAVVLCCTVGTRGKAAPQVGDKAPAVKVAKWVTKEPPALPGGPKAGKHVFVIEFWATWCRPCLKSIPHLAGLQKKHEKNGLVVIGVSDEESETIAAFIDKKLKMPYYVGSDDEMATTTAWTKDIEYIPYAFLVDRAGFVVWRGNPLDDAGTMDKVIEQVLAGKFDLEAAKAAAMTAKKFDQLMSELNPAYEAKDQEKFFKLLDQMIALRPLALHPYVIKREMLREFGRAEQIPAWDARIREVFKDSAVDLRQLVQFELGKDLADRSAEMLLRCALRANALTQGRDAEVLFTLARVQCEMGMLDEAITSQELAVALAPDDAKDRYRRVLSYYMAVRKLVGEQRQ